MKLVRQKWADMGYENRLWLADRFIHLIGLSLAVNCILVLLKPGPWRTKRADTFTHTGSRYLWERVGGSSFCLILDFFSGKREADATTHLVWVMCPLHLGPRAEGEQAQSETVSGTPHFTQTLLSLVALRSWTGLSSHGGRELMLPRAGSPATPTFPLFFHLLSSS